MYTIIFRIFPFEKKTNIEKIVP